MVEQNVVGEIDDGLLVFIGISSRDSQDDIDYIVDKTINLRIFLKFLISCFFSLKSVLNGGFISEESMKKVLLSLKFSIQLFRV